MFCVLLLVGFLAPFADFDVCLAFVENLVFVDGLGLSFIAEEGDRSESEADPQETFHVDSPSVEVAKLVFGVI